MTVLVAAARSGFSGHRPPKSGRTIALPRLGQKTDLQSHACVFVFNVEKLDEAEWGSRLNHYVHEGGDLRLGSRSTQPSRELQIPDRLPALASRAAWREAQQGQGGRPHSARSPHTHPLFVEVRSGLNTVLATVPVYRYWPVKPPVEGAHTLLSFSDGAPALLERTFKWAPRSCGSCSGPRLAKAAWMSARPGNEPERLE